MRTLTRYKRIYFIKHKNKRNIKNFVNLHEFQSSLERGSDGPEYVSISGVSGTLLSGSGDGKGTGFGGVGGAGGGGVG